jgi:signal transduction histidine kinase
MAPGEIRIHLEDLNVIDVPDEVLRSIAPLAAAKLVRLERSVCADFAIRADRVGFKQILCNLLRIV